MEKDEYGGKWTNVDGIGQKWTKMVENGWNGTKININRQKSIEMD